MSFNFTARYPLVLGQLLALKSSRSKYFYISPSITAGNFPHDETIGDIDIEAEYMPYDPRVAYRAILAGIQARGFRPATLVELLSFRAVFPQEDTRDAIIALGSIWESPDGPSAVLVKRGEVRTSLVEVGPVIGSLLLVVRDK